MIMGDGPIKRSLPLEVLEAIEETQRLDDGGTVEAGGTDTIKGSLGVLLWGLWGLSVWLRSHSGGLAVFDLQFVLGIRRP